MFRGSGIFISENERFASVGRGREAGGWEIVRIEGRFLRDAGDAKGEGPERKNKKTTAGIEPAYQALQACA